MKILYRGNTISGWISAYLFNIQFGDTYTEIIPVDPKNADSWPPESYMDGQEVHCMGLIPPKHILQSYCSTTKFIHIWYNHPNPSIIVDEIGIDETCYEWADYTTASDFKHFNYIHRYKNHFIGINVCGTPVVTHWYHEKNMKHFVDFVNRIEQMKNPTEDDFALREILHEISCVPQKHGDVYAAIRRTAEFINNFNDESKYEQLVKKGANEVYVKNEIFNTVSKRGQIINLDALCISTWSLPESWDGHKVFILNNTDYVIDTSYFANKVFTQNPDVHIFVNYRMRTNPNKGKTEYQYYARSRNGTMFNLTEKDLFKGQSHSAGGIYSASSDEMSARETPFII